MDMQICTKCGIEQHAENFNWRKLNKKRHSQCKTCTRANCDKHFKENRDYYLEKRSRVQISLRASNEVHLYDYLLLHPCVECGESEPIFLDFDHLVDKSHNISQMIASHKWSSIQKEIKKCQVLCVKCHRIKTSENAGWYRYKRYKNIPGSSNWQDAKL